MKEEQKKESNGLLFLIRGKESKIILLRSLSGALQKEWRIVHQKINAAVQRVLIQRRPVIDVWSIFPQEETRK